MAGTVLLTVSAFCLLGVFGCRVVANAPAVTASAPQASGHRPTFAATLAPPQTGATLLEWSIPSGNTADTITEVWASTNLAIWTLKTNVAGNSVRIPHNGPMEFYRTRSKFTFYLTNAAGRIFTNDVFSDWTRH